MVLLQLKIIHLLDEICCNIMQTFHCQMMNIFFTQTVLIIFMYIVLLYSAVCFFGLLFTNVDIMNPCLEMSGRYHVR